MGDVVLDRGEPQGSASPGLTGELSTSGGSSVIEVELRVVEVVASLAQRG